MTDNHDYDTPGKGTTDWHTYLNGNFRALDTDVEVRDTAANRGQYTPTQGSKFLETDTGTVYLGDGTEWQRIGSLSPGGVPGTAWFASVENLVVPVGAGLGVEAAVDPETTDRPVQDAIDAIGRDNEGAVLLPPTTVEEAGPIVGGNTKQLLGWGMLTSEIRFTDPEADGIAQDPDIVDDWQYSSVSGVRLDGGGPSRTGGSAIHFEHAAVPAFTLDRVDIPEWGGPDPVVWADTGHWFDSVWGLVKVGNTTSRGNAFQWDNGGSPNTYEHLTLNAGEAGDGKAMRIAGDMQATIGTIEVVTQGNDFAVVDLASTTSAACFVSIGTVNYEGPQSIDSAPDAAIVHKSGPGYLEVDKIQVQQTDATVNHGFTDRTGDGHWHVQSITDTEAPNAYANAPLRLHRSLDGRPATYGGTFAEVTDNAASHETGLYLGGENYLYHGERLRGTVRLSNGRATIATGITDQNVTIDVALGVASGEATEVASRAFWDEETGEHVVVIDEQRTRVRDPRVNYHITRRPV